MTVGKLIKELEKLPKELEIYICDYNYRYNAEVCWDIDEEDYKEGATDEPYIYLTKKGKL